MNSHALKMLIVGITSRFSSPVQIPRLWHRSVKRVNRALRLTSGLAILFLFFMLEGRAAQVTETSAPTEIVLGMSTVLTGASGELGKDMQRGIKR
jgi:hypothetical protein